MPKQYVLVVDDRKENILAITRILKKLDIYLVTAGSGEEALRKVINHPFALVLLDVMMPGMGGFEVAELMRSSKRTKNIPIIFVTAMGRDSQQIFRGYEAGAVDYLLKPIDPDVLLSKVRVLLDLDKQKQELAASLAEKQQSEEIIRVLMNAHSESALLLSRAGAVLALNEIAAQRMKVRQEDALGCQIFPLLSPVQSSLLRDHLEQLQLHGQLVRYEEQLDGRLYSVTLLPIAETYVETYADNKANNKAEKNAEFFDKFALFARDITKEREDAEKLKQLANFDQLTGLSNRTTYYSFQDRLIASASRNHSTIAVLFIDLDRFKQINDSLGHGAGDELLTTVAKRLVHCVRKSDVVARLGGDEFAVVTSNIKDQEHAGWIAKKIIASVIQPLDYQGVEINVGCSVGIACFPENGTERDELNKAADAAMYEAKKHGGNAYRFFDPELQRWHEERTVLVNGLSRAMEKDQLQIHYQPKFSAASGQMVGVEALMRWQFGERGMISPGVFIPLAEDVGLIGEFGCWIFKQACEEIKRLNDKQSSCGLLSVSINVSPKQLKVEGFNEIVDEVITGCCIEPSNIEVELTESSIMDDPEASIEVLNLIRSQGISIAVDDFGTGYSSLSYLRRLPLDTVKIDISFVRGIGQDKESEAIIKGIIALAQSLGLSTVAEGVETEEQLEFLRQQGCDVLQGFYLSKPLTIDELHAFARQHGNET